ncbi:MAG: replicative helicase [Candidatus Binatota bacterium]|nr:replicative helicase [Candidatus Binatota bacterium]
MEPVGKVPPQSLDAELAVLGGMLVDNNAIDRVVEVLSADDFYREAHRKIFRAAVDLYERREPVDLLTLTEALRSRGELADVGGAAYVSELPDRALAAANVSFYARIVHDKSTLRRVISTAAEIAAQGYEARENVGEFVDQAEQAMFRIAEKKARQSFVRVGSLIRDTYHKIEELYERKEMVTGVATGFRDLDAMTAGLQPSDLIIVAGRPSMGKCLSADAEIVLADGSVRTIEDLVRRQDGMLWTLGAGGILRTIRPSAFVDDGKKPVFRVTTRLGRSVKTTLVHPFLGVDGWKPLSDIRVGDRVAVPRRLPAFGDQPLGVARVKILAYLIGDGSLTGRCPGFTNGNPWLRLDFEGAIEEWGGLSVREHTSGGTRTPTAAVSTDLPALAAARGAFGRALRRRIRASGISARRLASAIDVSPGSLTHWCQGATSPAVSHRGLLAAALSCEPDDLGPAVPQRRHGNLLTAWLESLGLWGKSAGGKFVPDAVFRLPREELALFLNRLFACDGWICVLATGQVQIGYSTISERLARQVQHLLLRFGVIARLRRRWMRYRDTRRAAFQLDVTDGLSMRTFVTEIGIYGKEEPLRRAIERFEEASSRNRMLTEGDVCWDEIVSIEPAGIEQVYDLTVPKTHNFIANDVCVHNTSFCLNIAEHVAIENKTGVGIFSLEMSKEQLVLRLFCSQAGVDLNKLRTGFLAAKDFPKLALAAGRIEDAPIWVDDTPAISSLELRAKARRLARDREARLGLIVVDYLQLMRGSGSSDNREQEISEISRSLKALAKELNLPVIALSQLNRQVENRNPPKPRMADLRESGAIEQDADVIAFIYREEQYDPNTPRKGQADIIIAKQRNGPTGEVTLAFLDSYTRFENFTPEPEDLPDAGA